VARLKLLLDDHMRSAPAKKEISLLIQRDPGLQQQPQQPQESQQGHYQFAVACAVVVIVVSLVALSAYLQNPAELQGHGGQQLDARNRPMIPGMRQEDPDSYVGSTNILRVARSDFKTFRVRTSYSVASLFCGRDSALESWVFYFAAFSRIGPGILWALWWAGASLGLLTLAHFLPPLCIWFSVLMLPLPLVSSLAFSVDLLRELLMEFECYLVGLINVILLVSAIQILEDTRVVFWICSAPMIAICSMGDAYPPRFRHYFSLHFSLGYSAVMIVWDVLLIVQDFSLHDVQWQLADHLYFDLISNTITMSLTPLMFCASNIYHTIFKPTHFVILKAPVITHHEEFEYKKKKCDRDGDDDTTPHIYLQRTRDWHDEVIEVPNDEVDATNAWWWGLSERSAMATPRGTRQRRSLLLTEDKEEKSASPATN
jgi:hypothetical protein